MCRCRVCLTVSINFCHNFVKTTLTTTGTHCKQRKTKKFKLEFTGLNNLMSNTAHAMHVIFKCM